jgi:hypothetical protein
MSRCTREPASLRVEAREITLARTLIRAGRMRCLILPLVLLAACAPPNESHRHPVDPDANTCDIGAFQIAAPRADIHYAPTMDVVVDESELWAELTLTMVDELGDSYLYVSDSTAPYPGGSGSWWNQDKFHYELAPNHRYTVTVSHCANSQSVEFFTSPN